MPTKIKSEWVKSWLSHPSHKTAVITNKSTSNCLMYSRIQVIRIINTGYWSIKAVYETYIAIKERGEMMPFHTVRSGPLAS